MFFYLSPMMLALISSFPSLSDLWSPAVCFSPTALIPLWTFPSHLMFFSSAGFFLLISIFFMNQRNRILCILLFRPFFIPPTLPFFKKDRCPSERIYLICVSMDQLHVSRCLGFVLFPLLLYLCVLPRSLSGSHRGVPLQSLPRPFFVQSAFLLSFFLPLWYLGQKMKSEPTSALLWCDFRMSPGNNTSVTIFNLYCNTEKRKKANKLMQSKSNYLNTAAALHRGRLDSFFLADYSFNPSHLHPAVITWLLAANCGGDSDSCRWVVLGTGQGELEGSPPQKTGSSWVNILPGSEGGVCANTGRRLNARGRGGANNAPLCASAGQWSRFSLDSFQTDHSRTH